MADTQVTDMLYSTLRTVLDAAYDQAANGKGKERHNITGQTPFDRQRMQTVSELVGSPDGMTYQAIKKLTEGLGHPTFELKKRELLGAINYIAGIIIFLERQEKGGDVYLVDSTKEKTADRMAASAKAYQESTEALAKSLKLS